MTFDVSSMEINKKPNKKWYRRWWGILSIFFLIILISFIFAVIFYIAFLTKEIKKSNVNGFNFSESLTDEKTLELINGDGSNYWIGTSDPLLTIVEFGDFACPHCRNSFTKIREASVKYSNQIKIVFRDYPVVSENSLQLALASRCAGEQGLFWAMHDQLFLNQSSTLDIYKTAEAIGVDKNRFSDCISSEKYLNSIKKDYVDAEKLNVQGTPTFFINGHRIEGDLPIELIDALIEKITNNN